MFKNVMIGKINYIRDRRKTVLDGVRWWTAWRNIIRIFKTTGTEFYAEPEMSMLFDKAHNNDGKWVWWHTHCFILLCGKALSPTDSLHNNWVNSWSLVYVCHWSLHNQCYSILLWHSGHITCFDITIFFDRQQHFNVCCTISP